MSARYDLSLEDMAEWCLNSISDRRLNDWERLFIVGMAHWIEDDQRKPTTKQARRLELIFAKLGGM
jgi:hypothetical protein